MCFFFSENISILHACGTVTIWSPRGVEMGSYEGRHSGAWVFDDLLYVGSDRLDVYDPAKPNVAFIKTGNLI